MRDGTWYESYPSYVNSVENNLTGIYTYGHAPSLNKIVHSINFMDVNGALHVLNSSNSYEENGDKKMTTGHYALNGPMNESSGLWVSKASLLFTPLESYNHVMTFLQTDD